MGTASIIFGVIGMILTLIGLIPFCGFIFFVSVPLLLIGLILGIIGIVKNDRVKRGTSIAGLIICILFIILSCTKMISSGSAWVLLLSSIF